MVESGSVREVFAHPRDEYTRRLIDSVPARLDDARQAGDQSPTPTAEVPA